MTLKQKIVPVCATLLFAMGAASVASAGDIKDLRRLDAAKISLVDAIGIAEKARDGKAIEAEIDADRRGRVVYDVVVVNDKRFYEIRVDAENGKILRDVEDKD